MDAITREAILTLTKRVADLEAAVEVHRTMLKELTHGHAVAMGTRYDEAAFELQMSEAILAQREKMALGVEETTLAPTVHIIPENLERTPGL